MRTRILCGRVDGGLCKVICNGYKNKTDIFHVPDDFRSNSDSYNILLFVSVMGGYRFGRKIVRCRNL